MKFPNFRSFIGKNDYRGSENRANQLKALSLELLPDNVIAKVYDKKEKGAVLMIKTESLTCDLTVKVSKNEATYTMNYFTENWAPSKSAHEEKCTLYDFLLLLQRFASPKDKLIPKSVCSKIAENPDSWAEILKNSRGEISGGKFGF